MEESLRADAHAGVSAGVSAEVIVVRLGGSRYALATVSVAEVARPPDLTRVPGLPSWVAGLANWRGRVLAVLDLRPLLGSEIRRQDRQSRLVVLHHADVRVGLLVEVVDGTLGLDLDRLEPTPPHLAPQAAALLAGQVTDVDGPLGVLDLDALLGLSATLPRARRAG